MTVEGLGPLLTLFGTFGGIWGVLVMFRRFQNDFDERYRTELAELRQRLDGAHKALDAEREMRLAAELECARRGQVIATHGIPYPTEET